MLSKWISLLVLSLLILPTMAQTECVQPSRLIVGESGMVTPGDGNNVRAQATTDAQLIGVVNWGEPFTILQTSVCDESYVWVQIETDEFTGWTVEADDESYWVQPVTGDIYTNAFISLMMPPELISDVTFDVSEPLRSMGGLLPIRLTAELELVDEPENILTRLRFQVAPIANFDEEAFGRGIEAVNDLQLLFEVDPPILELDLLGQPIVSISDPFIFGANRLLAVQPHFVDMQNGRGIAFVTMYGQDSYPAHNDAVFYNFVGITDDEQYLVSFSFPIRTDMLPEADDDFNLPDNWRDMYTTYIEQATESLNTLSSDDWEPSLATLDSIVNSIYIIGGFENEE